jgi:N-methylhydantoinase B
MSDEVNDHPAGDGHARVRMALLASRLQTVVRKMANTLFRTARSGVLNSGHDFSCAILTADCRLVAAAESIPIHVMAGPDLIVRYVAEMHPEPRRGDAFLHNSPYHGNSHAADHCLVVPIVDDAGALRYWALVKAHQADCGNTKPTTYVGDARDLYEEGALIFPAVRIQRDYKDLDDIVRMCRMRIRVPEQWWGDYLAALGAARIGERELLAIGREIGWEMLDRHAEDWLDYSERQMASALGRLNSGHIVVTTCHDPFPGVPDGIPLRIGVTVDAEAGRVEVDLRDNPDCQPCGLNLTQGCSIGAALIGVFNGIRDHGVPPNAGSFRRVDIKLRENCTVGIPRHPFSCSVATTNLADRVSSPVQRAIAELADGFGMAEGGPIFPPAGGVISGNDPRRDDASFVNQVHLGLTGGAAGPVADGWITTIHVGNAGMCRLDGVEVDELEHPIRIRERRLLADTEGAGTFRGAPGIRVELGPIERCHMRLFYTADGMINVAQGTRGGGAGGPVQSFKRVAAGTLLPQPACAGVELAPGETIVSISSGGGGYGPPERRAVQRVQRDVAEGYVSASRAAEVYGVYLDGSGRIDETATAARRGVIAAGAGRA